MKLTLLRYSSIWTTNKNYSLPYIYYKGKTQRKRALKDVLFQFLNKFCAITLYMTIFVDICMINDETHNEQSNLWDKGRYGSH